MRMHHGQVIFLATFVSCDLRCISSSGSQSEECESPLLGNGDVLTRHRKYGKMERDVGD